MDLSLTLSLEQALAVLYVIANQNLAICRKKPSPLMGEG